VKEIRVPSSNSHRVPSFLSHLRLRAPAPVASFGVVARAEVHVPPEPVPVPVRVDSERSGGMVAAAVVFPPVAAAPVPGVAETAARVELAVERLRTLGEKLAAEARADALEVALAVARRIVETELTVNLDAQVAFIRTAIRRLGESRSFTLRLNPTQAARMESDGRSELVASAGAARIEIVPDASLALGDCLVDGDLGSIDGRLSSRFEEIRRTVLAALVEAQP
jgi:hypothetical protein